MLQGLIAGWIFILFMAVLFCDEKLRHAIPNTISDFLAAVVVTLPIWLPLILYSNHKRVKEKKHVVEVEVLK